MIQRSVENRNRDKIIKFYPYSLLNSTGVKVYDLIINLSFFAQFCHSLKMIFRTTKLVWSDKYFSRHFLAFFVHNTQIFTIHIFILVSKMVRLWSEDIKSCQFPTIIFEQKIGKKVWNKFSKPSACMTTFKRYIRGHTKKLKAKSEKLKILKC